MTAGSPTTDRAIPALPSRALDRTRDFYAGFGFATHHQEDGWLILRRGTLQLEFFPHEGLDPFASSARAVLRVADLDELVEAIRAAGVPIGVVGFPRLHLPVLQPWGRRAGDLIDLDCTQLTLIEEPSRDSPQRTPRGSNASAGNDEGPGADPGAFVRSSQVSARSTRASTRRPSPPRR